MMKKIKGFMAAILAVSVMACFSGCKDEHEHKMLDTENIGDIAQEEMPYGSTLTQLRASSNEKLKMDIEYDNRFLTEEEAIKVADSITALNTCDTELWGSTLPSGYVYYLMSVTESESVAAYLQERTDAIAEYAGEGFDFNYISVNSCKGEDENDFTKVDGYLSKAGITGEITSRKLIGIDMYYSLPDGSSSNSLKSKTGTDYYLNIYVIDGEIYII